MVSRVVASVFHVNRLGTTDSTNDWLLAAARRGAVDRSVAVADFQRRGRGRLDRRWEAPPGTSLLCSVLLRVPLVPEDRHLAAVAVALAAVEACRATAGVDVRLKWPNDLVVNDHKLGGILAETDGREDRDGATAIVVGRGLTLRSDGPPGAGGISLSRAAGHDVGRDATLDALLDALAARDDQLRDPDARRALADAYRDRLVTLGRRVRVALHDGAIEGTATDVTDGGELIVETSSGPRTVTSGDVVHLRDLRGRPQTHG